MPRVSVIVPNYNHEKFLAQRLESVLGQSFGDFELLFLDDASTDKSLEVFRAYSKDPRIRVCLNENNSGSPFKQWNRGFDLATGDYIWIAESDDYSDPRFLEVLVAALDANPEAALAYCQSWLVIEGETFKTQNLVRGWYEEFADAVRWNDDFTNSGRSELAKYMVFKNTILNASAVLFRASLLKDGLRSPENMRLAGDWMFWSQLLSRGDVVFSSRPMNYFRGAHDGSQRVKTEKLALELMEGLDVYSYVDQVAGLELQVRKNVLQYQVMLWGRVAYSRRLDRHVNGQIYKKLLVAHPEARNRRIRTIFLPFWYHFMATPFKRIGPLLYSVRALKRISHGIFNSQDI
ncbi:MAG: glycosyltransferase family 2 protein [Xanthomonadales bacterium]|nr:glycosyltransferase family 2 protein [Xanthomonadales bacterium]